MGGARFDGLSRCVVGTWLIYGKGWGCGGRPGRFEGLGVSMGGACSPCVGGAWKCVCVCALGWAGCVWQTDVGRSSIHLGDHFYKRNKNLPPEEQMISSLPDIKVLTLNEEHDFMVIACDGIW